MEFDFSVIRDQAWFLGYGIAVTVALSVLSGVTSVVSGASAENCGGLVPAACDSLKFSIVAPEQVTSRNAVTRSSRAATDGKSRSERAHVGGSSR